MSEAEESLKSMTRAEVEGCIVKCLHEGRSMAQANIELLEIGGRRYILKDFHRRGRLIRFLWGRRIIAREARVYRRLNGIEGIPRVLRVLDRDGFIMEYVPGTRIPHRRDSALTPVFFERLKAVMGRMHERGITHGDIRRKNILVTEDGRPFVIDFAGAFCVKPESVTSRIWSAPFRSLQKAVFRRLKKVDEITVLGIQHHLLPDSLSPEEQRRLQNVPWYLRFGRLLKKKVYRPIKHAFWD
ncbi:MAG TPA: RIO1 family regulatory kinase/ATPase [Candidatus Sumerlaeota bacterium]|nr:RIO1 family regulatory kinase/ATPase [Candidatus Sumerlaeota bacterium]